MSASPAERSPGGVASDPRTTPLVADPRTFAVAVLLICLIATGLRLWKIGSESYWVDEWFSRWRAFVPILDAVRGTGTQTSPPLYYLLLKPWVFLFGDSEAALRFPSALAGVLAIPVVARVARRLFDERTGALAAVLLAVSPFHVYYSQEARMYTLVVLLGLLSTEFSLAQRERPTCLNRVGYIASSAAILYTHYFGGLVIVAQGIAAAVAAVRNSAERPAMWRWARDVSAVGILFAPWLLALTRNVAGARGPLGWIPRMTVSAVLETLSASAGSMPLLVAGLVVFGVGVLASARGRVDRRLSPEGWTLLVGWLVIPHAALAALSLAFFPLYVDRYAIVALPALSIGVAAGLQAIRPAAVRNLAIVSFLGLSLAAVTAGYERPDKPQWREAAEFVAGRATGSDLIILSGFESRYYVEHNPALSPLAACYQNGEEPDCTRSGIESHRRVWYLQQSGWELRKDFLLGYRERGRKEFAQVSVVLFESSMPVVGSEAAP